MFKFTRHFSIACGLLAVCAQILCVIGTVGNGANNQSKTEIVAKICAKALKTFAAKTFKSDAEIGNKFAQQKRILNKKSTLSNCDCISEFAAQCSVLELPFEIFEIQKFDFHCKLASQIVESNSGFVSLPASVYKSLPQIRAPACIA